MLKKTNPEVLKKVTAVAGDVQEVALGLSPEDRKTLTENVNMIYHAAASIRFDDPLKKAVFLNVRGTKFMLELAKQCTNLIVSIYSQGSKDIYFSPPPRKRHVLVTKYNGHTEKFCRRFFESGA